MLIIQPPKPAKVDGNWVIDSKTLKVYTHRGQFVCKHIGLEEAKRSLASLGIPFEVR